MCMLQGSDLPTKGDLVEERLYMQYKADLWKHMATKTGLLEAPCKHEHQAAAPNMQPGMHEHMGGAVPFQFEPDGSLTLRSSCHAKEHGSAAIKQEEGGESENIEEPQADGAKAAHVKEEELDAYATAAIAALGQRNAKNKDAQKEENRKKRIASLMMRPAAAVKKNKVKEDNKHVKKDAVKTAVKHEINIVTKATIQNHMPKANSDVNVKPPAVHYGGGVIYTDLKRKKFRCLRDRRDSYTETQITWASKRTMKEARQLAYAAIDDYNPKMAAYDKARRST